MIPAEKSRIVAITRLSTANVGNQALSSELIRLTRSIFDEDQVAYLGRPGGYAEFSTEKLRHNSTLSFSRFEEWSDRLLEEYHSCARPRLHFNTVVPTVTLAKPSASSMRLVPLKRYLDARRWLAQLDSNAAVQSRTDRFSVFDGADLVIYNPAGEINPIDGSFDTPLRQFLELRVAQKLGCRIAIVNHSVEIKDPMLAGFIGMLYSQFNLILVRDSISRDLLTSWGVPNDRVHVVPDAAVLARAPGEERLGELVSDEGIVPDTVGIAPSYHLNKEMLEGWGKIIQALQGRGKRVIFVSNALAQDRENAKLLAHRYGISIMSKQYEYSDYIGLLSKVEMVISSRLHTSVFCLVGGTPVIPVESLLFKIKGALEQFNYPVKVVNQSQPGWESKVIHEIDHADQNYDELKAFIGRQVSLVRQRIRSDYRKYLLNTLA